MKEEMTLPANVIMKSETFGCPRLGRGTTTESYLVLRYHEYRIYMDGERVVVSQNYTDLTKALKVLTKKYNSSKETGYRDGKGNYYAVERNMSEGLWLATRKNIK